jgi:ATP-binding cassette, subfamily F, member 3
MTLFSLAAVGVDFGGRTLLDRVTWTVTAGDRWGIVGRNGTGKTTLFRLLTGELEPTRGSVARSAGLRIGLLDQHRDFPEDATVWEVAAGPLAPLLALERELEELATEIATHGDHCPPELLARYDRDLERFQREDGYTIGARVDAVLHGLGFDPADARRRTVRGLSGGERGRLGLAAQLVGAADLLLLDEPTNHLDLETTRWLEDYLLGFGGTVLVVSHDRAFLQRVANHILHLEAGTVVPYDADWAAFVHQRAERRLSQQRAYDQQRRVLGAEEDYIRRNIAGQNSKQAKGRRRRLERVERLSPPPGEEGAMALRLSAPDRGGDQVLKAENLSLGIDGRVLLENFSVSLRRGDVVGLVGPNGAGKSTLLRTIMRERSPSGGELRVPDSLSVAHYRQDLTQVPTDLTVYDVIAHLRPAWGRGPVQDHLGRFGFSGDSVKRIAGTLSGGERARVALAMLMLQGAHLLLLDEPTNHLDVESIEALEDAINEYDGTLILVSHDRQLLRDVTTRTWVLRGTRILDYDGGFAEWEEAEAERARAAAAEAARARAEERRNRDSGRAGSGGKERRRDAEVDRRAQQSAARSARRELEAAEAAVHAAEARVAGLRAQLEDPSLYVTLDARVRAAALEAELSAAGQALEAAVERWTVAGEAVQALGTT